jgi:hypothetical protein
MMKSPLGMKDIDDAGAAGEERKYYCELFARDARPSVNSPPKSGV